jgi:hypothetical protein
MRRLLFRLAVSGSMLLVGIATSSVRNAFGHRQVRPSENIVAQVNAPSVIQTLKDKSPATESVDPYDIMVRGRYTNFDYAFSVLVPAGMMGATSPAPNPQHGFGINLINPTTTFWTMQEGMPGAYLFVDGSYNSAELASLEDAMQESLKFLNEQYGNSRLLSKTPTRLGGLRALRFVASYGKSDEKMIVYSIELTTPASRYARDKSLVAQIQKSWLVDPSPDIYPLPPVYVERK